MNRPQFVKTSGASLGALVLGLLLLNPRSAAKNPADNNPFTRAAWIMPSSTSSSADIRPCPVLRKSFRVDENVSSATVRVVGLGHFELISETVRADPVRFSAPFLRSGEEDGA